MKKKFFDCVGKVRKSLTMLGLVLCCAMTASVFTSCGSDDDNNDLPVNPTTTDKKATTAVVDLSILQTTDFLQYFDVSFEYSNGTTPATDSMPSTGSWTKTLTVKLPGTITIKQTVKQKTENDLSTNTSKFNIYLPNKSYGYSYSLKDATGKEIGKKDKKQGESELYTVSHLAELVTKGSFNKTLTLSFDADGNLTESSWK